MVTHNSKDLLKSVPKFWCRWCKSCYHDVNIRISVLQSAEYCVGYKYTSDHPSQTQSLCIRSLLRIQRDGERERLRPCRERERQREGLRESLCIRSSLRIQRDGERLRETETVQREITGENLERKRETERDWDCVHQIIAQKETERLRPEIIASNRESPCCIRSLLKIQRDRERG